MTQSRIKELQEWIDAENELEVLRKEKRKLVDDADSRIRAKQAEIDDIKAAFDADMKANGVLEDLIEGRNHNYKISYAKQPEKVIVDADAVPDDYCKIERKPMLKEIKDMLQSGAQTNWARLERGDPQITWKMVKK